MIDWQRAQQDRVDETENGGVGADSQRECDHGNRHKPRPLDQASHGVANVFD